MHSIALLRDGCDCPLWLADISLSVSKQGNNFRHRKCTNRQRYTWKLRGMKSMPTEVIHRNYHESGSRIRNFNAGSTERHKKKRELLKNPTKI